MSLLATRGLGTENTNSNLIVSFGLGGSDFDVLITQQKQTEIILKFSLGITRLLNFMFDRNKCKC